MSLALAKPRGRYDDDPPAVTSTMPKMDAVEKTAATGTDKTTRMNPRTLLRLAARAPDSYVLLLALLVVDYVMLTVPWTGSAAALVRTLLFALTVLLAFHTSRVPPRLMKVVRVGVAVAMLAAFVVVINPDIQTNDAEILITSGLLLTAPFAIGWRIVHHQKVSGETIAGAICIYILIGMIFADLDYGVQLASGRFFAQPGPHGLPDFAYFSYVTMATVGYGDLTPTTGFPRTLSVLDALVGQIFLVVLLARLVSMYRGAGPLGWRESLEERIGSETETSGEEI